VGGFLVIRGRSRGGSRWKIPLLPGRFRNSALWHARVLWLASGDLASLLGGHVWQARIAQPFRQVGVGLQWYRILEGGNPATGRPQRRLAVLAGL
jgi:hypothetical protein